MYIREVRQCGKNRVADIRHFFKAAKIPPVFRKNRKKILPHRWEVQRVKKASQSLPPAGGKEMKSFSLATCA